MTPDPARPRFDPGFDPLTRFVEIHGLLQEERGWFDDPSALRFAAIAAIPAPGSPRQVAEAIRAAAEAIRVKTRWYADMRSPVRFVVGALLACHGDRVEAFLAESERVRSIFRELKLRRGESYEALAVLILRLQNRQRPILRSTVERFQKLYEEMKRHHWWLTGPDDFPACAVLTGLDGSPRRIGENAEAIFQALHAAGFTQGDPLQTAANLLCLADAPAHTIAGRFRALAEGFSEQGIAMWQSDYDELAVLSFLDRPPREVIARVVELRGRMKELRPKPDRSTTFTLAAGITFIESVIHHDASLAHVADAKTLLDVQAVIQAQQAAVASAGATAAVH